MEIGKKTVVVLVVFICLLCVIFLFGGMYTGALIEYSHHMHPYQQKNTSTFSKSGFSEETMRAVEQAFERVSAHLNNTSDYNVWLQFKLEQALRMLEDAKGISRQSVFEDRIWRPEPNEVLAFAMDPLDIEDVNMLDPNRIFHARVMNMLGKRRQWRKADKKMTKQPLRKKSMLLPGRHPLGLDGSETRLRRLVCIWNLQIQGYNMVNYDKLAAMMKIERRLAAVDANDSEQD